MSDWMTVRVVLTGRSGAPLVQPPGRVLLVHADHAFSDLAEAIDTAFGRWDLTPLHQFDVEGRVLVTSGAAEAVGVVDAEDSDIVTIGEVGLRAGARFGYVFDIGEGWEHECTVEDVGIDPFELTGEEPDVPVPVYGWGTLPDQYGRMAEDDEETDVVEEIDADALIAADDGGVLALEDEADYADAELDEDDDELDDDEEDEDEEDEDWEDAAGASWDVVARALADVEGQADPEGLTEIARMLRAEGGRGEDETVAVLWAAAGMDPSDPPDDDEALWTELAAGVVRPEGDVPLDDDTTAAWTALEPADWAGAVIELVRAGPGTTASPRALIGLIERCPEVESGDLSEEDEAIILDGLDVVVALWRVLGAVDEEHRLTRLGMWGLPRALERAWQGGAAS